MITQSRETIINSHGLFRSAQINGLDNTGEKVHKARLKMGLTDAIVTSINAIRIKHKTNYHTSYYHSYIHRDSD